MSVRSIPYVDGDAIRAAMTPVELLDTVEDAYREVAAGRDRSPLRMPVELENGTMLLMPGVREGGSGSTVKLVTWMPGNAERGEPTIQAVVIWFEGKTGRPRAIFDGAAITAMRTGAASGVGTRLLARPDAATLAVLGAGGQAEWQIRAVLAARSIQRVTVFARSPQGREAFAARMDESLAVPVVAAESAEDAVRGADIVCCATSSAEPVFDASWLRPGTHVNGIGAFRHGMIELPPELFRIAELVGVDSRTAALAEAGDVVEAIARGMVAEEDLVEIGSVARDYAVTRDPDAITAFKSVGLAIQDLATVEVLVKRLLPAD